MKEPIDPQVNHCQYLTTITVHILQGQNAKFVQKLHEICAAGKHLLPGTVSRYIMQNATNPDEVQIMLIWSGATLPIKRYTVALAALRDDLAEILDWETAVYRESQIIMHA